MKQQLSKLFSNMSWHERAEKTFIQSQHCTLIYFVLILDLMRANLQCVA